MVVDYAEDTERKRAEYLLDNWDEGEVESVRGLSRRVVGVDIEELYERLVSKVPEDQVETYELDPVDASASERTEPFEFAFDTDRDRVEWAMEAIMNKRKRVTQDAEHNVYGIYTKKGRARVSYSITELPTGEVRLTGEVSGYGEAPAFLRDFIGDELEYMV